METKMYLAEVKSLRKEAVEKFAEEKPEHGSMTNYKWALYRHVVSYGEYIHCYRFWNKNKKQQKEYASEYEMRCIYRKTVQVSVGRMSLNKILTIRHFENHISRKWIYPKEVSYESFESFMNATDCIVKPIIGTFGEGIFLVEKNSGKDLQELYALCCEKKLYVEERIKEHSELEAFHPQSLNTIRIFTISNDNLCKLVAAELRVGVGNSVVDNVSAGGIFAPIDLASGTIIGDGSNKYGNTYKSHPDTGKVFNGFVIPFWEKIIDTCKTLSATVTGITFAGWDVCVLPSGELEIIEMNSYPNVTGLQTAYNKGLKPEIRAIGKEVLGYDPTKLIPVWSKSHVKYDKAYGMC